MKCADVWLANHLTRRRFVLGVGTAAVAAACSGPGGPNAQEPAPSLDSDPFVDDGSRFLQAAFADGFHAPSMLVAGQSARAPFALTDGNGLAVVNGAPDAIEATLTGPDGEARSLVLASHVDGLAVPHYSLLFDPTDAGVYGLTAQVEGQQQQLEFIVAEQADVPLVQVGDALRPVGTPTFDDARGFDPICTRFEPCPFHEDSLADVMTNGRPTALLIATPGFCQTVSCGPVVDLLIDLDPRDTMNVIHAEVYNEPARINEIGLSPELLGPIVTTYQMDFEPSFVVADASGTVTARLDYSFDRTEIAAALATAL